MTADIFFYLSKIIWILTNPGILLLGTLVLGAGLLWTPWWRRGRGLLAVGALAAFVLATVPLGPMLLTPLENRFPPPRTLPAKVDGIIALGGVADLQISRARGRAALGGAVERLTELARLARIYPEAKLVFTGGSALLLNQEIKEADVLDPLFDLLNLTDGRLILESQARNTVENATLTRDLMNPGPDETWILITSAFHMPRAMGVFRKAGWTSIIPYPVDYNLAGYEWKEPFFDLTRGLGGLTQGLHEWLGLVAYRLSGKIDDVFPAP